MVYSVVQSPKLWCISEVSSRTLWCIHVVQFPTVVYVCSTIPYVVVYFCRQLYYRVSLLSPPITMNVYALMGCLFCIGLSIGVVLAVGMLFVYQVRPPVGWGMLCGPGVAGSNRGRFTGCYAVHIPKIFMAYIYGLEWISS